MEPAVLAFVAAATGVVLSGIAIAQTKARSLLAWAAAAASAAAAFLAAVKI